MANGEPVLLNPPAASAADQPMTSDQITNGGNATGWGVYLNGALVIQPDSIVTLSYKNEARISNYPQEHGAFASYNKVANPYDLRVVVTKGGTEGDRKSFIQTVEQYQKSLDLLDFVSPEKTYTGVNLVHMDYRRSATHGAGLLTVELGFIEIREIATQVFTATSGVTIADLTTPIQNAASASSNDPVNAGTQQPKTTATNVLQQAQKAIADYSYGGA